MKAPLHYQASEYDCVPTTFLNAVTYLFHREAIPPLVVHHIFLYSLDTVGKYGRLGRGGTSRHATRLLGDWLGSYRTDKFAVATEYLDRDQVHLRPGNKITACLNVGGVALCNIYLGRGEWHFVLAMKAQKERLLFFDPYWRLAIRGMKDHVEVLKSESPRRPNLAIRREWLDGDTNRRRFCLGTKRNRECLLMWKRK